MISKNLKFNEAKLSQVTVDNVIIPKEVIVTSAVAKPRYENSEMVENSISKIQVSYVEKNIFDILMKSRVDISALKTENFEIIDEDEKKLKSINIEELIGKTIDISSGKVYLGWVTSSFNSGWNKLVIRIKPEDIKIIGGEKNEK
ncbi:hypothetical protein [Helcococcus bovis]|uniref:hypothetical protein n=1 Tax=Helcococcus bovis TaxID=3153252 RepID=UPI0038B75641